MLITKVKAKREPCEILIEYILPHPKSQTGLQHISFPCKEEPRNEFYQALDALLPTAIEAIGLDPDQWEEGEIIGVSFKHCDDGIGLTITAKCQIKERFACPTTPYISPDGVPLFEGLQELMLNVITQAIWYIDGARRQGSILQQAPAADDLNRGFLGVLGVKE
ncbi:MAG TPA: hypothetical protein VK203_07420 [Nostocaceae cyanobacterium]|nr:hypothetical protein [Nostocaceae cyanobacterium]